MQTLFFQHIVVYVSVSHWLGALTEKNLSDKWRSKSHWPEKTAKIDVVKNDQHGERLSRIQDMEGDRGGGTDRAA